MTAIFSGTGRIFGRTRWATDGHGTHWKTMMRARRSNQRWLAIIFVLVWALGSTASLAQPATPVPPFPDPAAPEFGPVAASTPYRIALLVPFPNDPFWQAVQRAVEARAAADGIAIDVVTLTTPNAAEQIAQIENAVAQGYSGILLGPVDAEGVVSGIVTANEAGVPVVAIDVAPLGGEVVAVVETDDVAAARQAGNFIADAIGGTGTVLDLQGDLTSQVAQDRERGLQGALAAFPNIEVIGEAANWVRALASSLTTARLPDLGTPGTNDEERLSAVFAANDQMALGAADAVDTAKADEVLVIGFGATTETRSALQAGLITAVVGEFPDRAGAIAVDLMVRHLNGESVPATVDSGSALVTRDNLGEFPG
jgi:ABC-type sugar transport system substrate-binding protein